MTKNPTGRRLPVDDRQLPCLAAQASGSSVPTRVQHLLTTATGRGSPRLSRRCTRAASGRGKPKTAASTLMFRVRQLGPVHQPRAAGGSSQDRQAASCPRPISGPMYGGQPLRRSAERLHLSRALEECQPRVPAGRRNDQAMRIAPGHCASSAMMFPKSRRAGVRLGAPDMR
jgi:hypothetical protein